jgi:hypothetical protein
VNIFPRKGLSGNTFAPPGQKIGAESPVFCGAGPNGLGAPQKMRPNLQT